MQLSPEQVNVGLALFSAVAGVAIGGGSAVMWVQKLAKDAIRPVSEKVDHMELKLDSFYETWPQQLNGTYVRNDVLRPQLDRMSRDIDNLYARRRGSTQED